MADSNAYAAAGGVAGSVAEEARELHRGSRAGCRGESMPTSVRLLAKGFMAILPSSGLRVQFCPFRGVTPRISVARAETVLRRWMARSWSRPKTASGMLSLRPRVSPPVATRRLRAFGFASTGAAPLPCPETTAATITPRSARVAASLRWPDLKMLRTIVALHNRLDAY